MKESTGGRNINIRGKIGGVIACVALATTLGAGAALAASTDTFNILGQSPASFGVKSINVAPSKDGNILHIVKKGTHFYSVDGGETWNDAIPDGFILDGKGNLKKIM